MSSGKGTIKERLTCLETFLKLFKQDITKDVGECKTNLSNHLKHHWEVTLAVITALIVESVALVFLIIKLNIPK